MKWIWLLLGIILALSVGQTKDPDILVTPPTVQKVFIKDTKARDLLSKVFNRDMSHFRTGTMKVTLTAYSAVPRETNSQPEITAYNVPSRIGLVAISRDLEAVLSPGEVILLPNYGVFKVQDRMSTHKHKGTNPTPIVRTVDILHATPQAAKLFGVKKHEPLIFILED